MEFIQSAEWLAKRLSDCELRIVDCRFSLTDPAYGRQAFQKGHIPGAVFFDLEQDLSGRVQEHGGRHPLPDFKVLQQKLEAVGIDENTPVISYDNGEGAFASRFWWLLTYMGHKNVFVLDGGFKKWTETGNPVTSEINQHERKHFSASFQEHMLATYSEVKEKSNDGKSILIDSRTRERYLGLEEPIDKKPGRIPGALNKEWVAAFEDGNWKSREKQMERFADLPKTEEIIVYCGSGITATPNVLALMNAGFSNVKLYAGSYSDWVSYDENNVETGE